VRRGHVPDMDFRNTFNWPLRSSDSRRRYCGGYEFAGDNAMNANGLEMSEGIKPYRVSWGLLETHKRYMMLLGYAIPDTVEV